MESAAATTPNTITSLNDTAQEYVQEVPLESPVHVADGREVGVVVTLDENDADVHAIMSQTLPKHVIIQSNLNNVYLHLYTENPAVPNALRFTGDYSYELDTRFEVVPASTGAGLVHIRSLRNNKYWANFGTSNNWITAMAVKPEENQSDPFCTLFQPIFVYSNNNRVLKLSHVNTGYFVRLFYGAEHYSNSLSLSVKHDQDDDVCTFIDWDDVVMLPDLIRIKEENGFHLKALAGGYIGFDDKVDNSWYFVYEVSPSRDGGIRLKSSYFGNYWTTMDDRNMVLLKQTSSTVHDTNTVFIPIKYGDNRTIIRSLRNGLFCRSYTTGITESYLATVYNYPDEYGIMEIEEPVISRRVDNVRYHLTDARIYDEKTAALITDDSSNYTQSPMESELNLKTTVSNTSSWSTSVALRVGFKVSYTMGIPKIQSGSIEISADVTATWNWGGTNTESQDVGNVKKVTVAPNTRVRGSLMATRCSYDIPFTYTQHDILINGDTRTTEKNDGVFTANNGYNYRYQVVELPLEPLPPLE